MEVYKLKNKSLENITAKSKKKWEKAKMMSKIYEKPSNQPNIWIVESEVEQSIIKRL